MSIGSGSEFELDVGSRRLPRSAADLGLTVLSTDWSLILSLSIYLYSDRDVFVLELGACVGSRSCTEQPLNQSRRWSLVWDEKRLSISNEAPSVSHHRDAQCCEIILGE